MAPEISNDRIRFYLDADEPFELDELGTAFAGLASQYQKTLASSGIETRDAPAKLYVTRIRSGSLTFEIGSTLLAIYGGAHAIADGAVVFDDFYQRIKRYLEYLAGRAERPNDLTKSNVADFDSFLKTLSGKRGARLAVKRALFRKTTGRSQIVAEFEFDATELATAGARIATELGQSLEDSAQATPDNKHKLERDVPFIWHRTDREKGKPRGATSDRGIIAKITDKPLPVFFPSTSDEAKQRMTKVEKNPFNLVYIVDALVEYDDNNEPVSYTITELKKIT